MASEARRGCGYRKVGGLYLTCDAPGAPCCKMPIELHVCPTCNQGIKQTRGWQWIDPRPWLADGCEANRSGHGLCPLALPDTLGKRVGLLWIGAEFYPTPADFTQEALRLGVSRRIKTVPRGFKLGETWVFLAHPKVIYRVQTGSTEAKTEWIPGIFQVIRPTAVEKIITDVMAKDRELVADLEKRGITPVIVPAADPDHAAHGTTVKVKSEQQPDMLDDAYKSGAFI